MTFHRAIDMTRDVFKAADTVRDLGKVKREQHTFFNSVPFLEVFSWIPIWIRGTKASKAVAHYYQLQCCRSVTFWYGSGSADPCL
jgi:hypothetical protein